MTEQFKNEILSIAMCFLVVTYLVPQSAAGAEPLPSWRNGAARKRIIEFVRRVTEKSSPEYVKPADRIAVFDNDGTLWCEQPVYPQVVFACDRVKTVSVDQPDLAENEVFKAALDRDYDRLAATGAGGIQELVIGTHTGMTRGEFESVVVEWIEANQHPRFKKKYTECVYKPMLEVLSYFRSKGFKTCIVSGGGRDFMRPWAGAVYGITPENVLGSSCALSYRVSNDKPSIVRDKKIECLNDGPVKPVSIEKVLGKRPIAAFGNSDGDYEMLRWTTSGPGARLAVLIRHTDEKREYAYDRESKVGHLEVALDEAKKRDWLVVDMKDDWKLVFPQSAR